MSPSLAFLAWLVLLIGLLALDPARKRGIPLALWIPVIWFFFVGTRLPSQWLEGPISTDGFPAAKAFEDSDPLNRNVFLALTVAGFCVLLARSFKWGDFFRRNLWLMAFLCFALLSVCWSDFTLVSLRRWFRDLGAYLVMLIALSDPDPLEGMRTVLRRFCYLAVPLSVLLVKYFPELGRAYDAWSGAPVAVGAATAKNQLGVTCLVSMIVFFWDLVERWPDRRTGRTKWILAVDVAFMGMTGYLLYHAHSATSTVCAVIGCFLILAATTKTLRRYPFFFKTLIPTSFLAYVIGAYWFNANTYLVGAVGRNPDLTNRTLIWAALLRMGTNPVIGTGYRSFFMGERLRLFWQTPGINPGINEAHNGYLDLYLNLGFIGLLLFLGFLGACYGTIWKRFKTAPAFASFGLGLWTMLLFYNITEAAFDGGLLWLTLMLVGISLAGIDTRQETPVAVGEPVRVARRFSRVPLKTAGLRRSR